MGNGINYEPCYETQTVQISDTSSDRMDIIKLYINFLNTCIPAKMLV